MAKNNDAHKGPFIGSQTKKIFWKKLIIILRFQVKNYGKTGSKKIEVKSHQPALYKELSAILFVFTIVKIDYREKRER